MGVFSLIYKVLSYFILNYMHPYDKDKAHIHLWCYNMKLGKLYFAKKKINFTIIGFACGLLLISTL